MQVDDSQQRHANDRHRTAQLVCRLAEPQQPEVTVPQQTATSSLADHSSTSLPLPKILWQVSARPDREVEILRHAELAR